MKQISSFAKNFLTVHIISDMMPRYKRGYMPFEQDLRAFRDCRHARCLPGSAGEERDVWPLPIDQPTKKLS